MQKINELIEKFSEKENFMYKIGYIVSETHWDREWYLTFQEFRKWLVRLIDKLIYKLKNHPDFKSFMLDGQTIVIEDYLEIRPENEGELKRLINEGKIIIGPWYVLADEFLESGEGIIRNLIIGHKIGKKFGKIMKVGYVPDTFGHIWQLPQILQNFNIKYGYGFRGYPPLFGNHEEYKGKNENTPLEHYWQSPNEKYKILMLHHITGYGNAAKLCNNSSSNQVENGLYYSGVGKIADSFYKLTKRQLTPLLLLMNGGDHQEPEFELPRFIEFFNNEKEIQEEIPLILKHSTLEEYFNDLEEYCKKNNIKLPVLTGEWRGSMYTQVTPACISTRMYLKQLNYLCQTQLERYAEPLSVFSYIFGGSYDSNLILESWKWTIKNHPHDSICGCSIDRVHRDMETRFNWSLDISKDIATNAMAEICSGIDSYKIKNEFLKKFKNENPQFSDVYCEIIILFNVINNPQNVLLISSDLIKIEPRMEYRLFDYNFNEIDKSKYIIQNISDYRMLENGQALYKIFKSNYKCGKLVLVLENGKDIPQMGYKTFILVGYNYSKTQEDTNLINKTNQNVLNHKFIAKDIEIEFNSNGSFNIFDKLTNTKYNNLNLFEDMADDGDEYDYSPLKDEIPYFSSNCDGDFSIIEDNDIRTIIQSRIIFELPEDLVELDEKTRIRSPNLKPLNITSEIEIYKNSRVIRIKTKFFNCIKSHRIRAIFPTGINSDYSYADDHFMIMKRSIKLPRDDGWFQDMQQIYHQDTFVDINDGKRGLAIFNKGIPEFEVIRYNEKFYSNILNFNPTGVTIAITLVRGVGWLSKSGHLGRKSGLNGPNLPTIEAQCQREFTFEYAIFPHVNDHYNPQIYAEAYNFNYPFRIFDIFQIQNLRIKNLKEILYEATFFQIDNPNIIQTCLKKTETGLSVFENAIILRFFNPTNQNQKGLIRFPAIKNIKSIYEANLLEEPKILLRSAGIQDSIKEIEIEIQSNEIKTILLELK